MVCDDVSIVLLAHRMALIVVVLSRFFLAVVIAVAEDLMHIWAPCVKWRLRVVVNGFAFVFRLFAS